MPPDAVGMHIGADESFVAVRAGRDVESVRHRNPE